ncbi:cell division protein CrgA [Propionibacterium sp.]|uniref:cell division protein CrgA n=1 Tax=Propionibacterium sp. TaxID=1977903 RepID=UPI0039EC0852
MPESHVRKQAADRKAAQHKDPHKTGAVKDSRKRPAQNVKRKNSISMFADRGWVPWVFVPLGLIGVIWLVVFYIAGDQIPFMSALENWNFLIGLGLIAGSFFVATLWK